MSTIYDIAGTTSDAFNLNGKVTFLQGDEAPEVYQGINGDVYFRTNGLIYSKQNNTWLNLSSASLPDAASGAGKFIMSNGQNYEFAEIPVQDIVSLPDAASGAGKFIMSNGQNYEFAEIPVQDIASKTEDNVWSGNNTFTGTINGISMGSYWGDLAEYYESDNEYPKGTLVKFGGEKEITIADDTVNAVITSNPGFILNMGMNKKTRQAIALVGRVPVRVIGKCNKFDYLTLSDVPGIARALEQNEFPMNVIARALENKDEIKEDLVLCVVKLDL